MSSNENADPAQIGMRIRGANGQTANLFVVETYGGTDKFVVDKDGHVVVTGNLTLTGSLAYTGEMAITGDTAATITLKITGASGQSADLLVVEDNNGTDYFKVGATGNATLTGNLTQTGSQAITGEVQITGDTAATITTKITGASGQTADLFVVEQNDGTDVLKVDKDGKTTWPVGPTAVVEPGSMAANASYIVFKVGTTYYARNGLTGAVTSNANCATLVNGLLTILATTGEGTGRGGLIYFGEGVFELTTSILLLPYCSIIGSQTIRQGQMGTIFKCAFDGIAINATSGAAAIYAFVLKDFRIDGGNVVPGTYPNSTGIRLLNVMDGHIENVRMWYIGCNGFDFLTSVSNVYVRDCYVQDSGQHNYYVNGAGCAHISFDNCICDGGVRSLFIELGYWITVINCHFESPSNLTIYAFAGYALNIINTKVIGSGTEGIRLAAGWSKCAIDNCRIINQIGSGILSYATNTIITNTQITQGAGAYGIQLDGMNNCIISNNIVTGSGDGRNLILNGAGHVITGNIFTGNTTFSVETTATNSVISHNVLDKPMAGTFVGDVMHGNTTWVTEANLYSAEFAIDAVANITLDTSHGLSTTPALEDISLTLVQVTDVNDWVCGFVKLVSVDGTSAITRVGITVASATAGAKAKLAFKIDVR